MLLEFFRLSLLERSDLFSRVIGSLPTKEESIRALFIERIEFIHWKVPFIYVPDPAVEGPYIVGRIGRRKTFKDHEPPEGDLHERSSETWQAILVFVDPVDHPDGQKLAVERDLTVGQPFPLLRSLAAAMNNRPHPWPYELIVNPISDPSGFWDYVDEHENDIVSVTLEVTAPNMFRSKSDFNEEMKEFRENERVQELTLKLENPRGLNAKTQRLRDGVDYALSGGGVAKAKARGKRPYNSKNKIKKAEVAEPPPGTTVLDAIKSVIRRVFYNDPYYRLVHPHCGGRRIADDFRCLACLPRRYKFVSKRICDTRIARSSRGHIGYYSCVCISGPFDTEPYRGALSEEISSGNANKLEAGYDMANNFFRVRGRPASSEIHGSADPCLSGDY
jgi:hypothetical protein